MGYGFAVILAHFPVSWVVGSMRERVGKIIKLPLDKFTWQAAAVGFVERALFGVAFQSKIYLLIPLWFALKVAGGWGQWNKEDGRVIFNIFLLGSALSFGYAIAGVQSAIWAANNEWWKAIAIPLSLLLGSFLLWLWVAEVSVKKMIGKAIVLLHWK